MVDRADFLAQVDLQRQEQRKQVTPQLQTQIRVGGEMAELLADPRWQTYKEHLQAEEKHYRLKAAAAEAKLLSERVLSADEYINVKIDHISALGRANALRFAIEVVDQLVKTGKIAEEEFWKST